MFYVPVTLSEGHCEKFGKCRQAEIYPEERVEHTRVPGENPWDYQPENQYYLLTDESPFCPLKLSSVGKSHNHHFDYFCYCYRVSVFSMPPVSHYRPSVFKRWTWDLQCAQWSKCVLCTRTRRGREWWVGTSVDSEELKIGPSPRHTQKSSPLLLDL